MKRLTRIFLHALTVVSLILFMATVTLWVRGYYRFDVLGYRDEWKSARVESSSVSLAFIVALSSSLGPSMSRDGTGVPAEGRCP
jgi:hypothetical protein